MLQIQGWSFPPPFLVSGCSRLLPECGGELAADNRQTRHDEGSEVLTVDRQPSRKGNIVLVCTLFEPHRLERASLQRAYELVVPLRRRPVREAVAETQLDVAQTPQRRRA